MKRNFLYISLIASSALALTACTADDNAANNNTDNIGKTPIELSVGAADAAATTRAITVDPTDNALKTALPTGTSIYMVMKSDYVGTGSAQTSKYTMTKGKTQEANASTKEANIDFSETGCQRYWDDAFSRDAALSVYGVCTPSGTPVDPTISGSNTYTYTSTPTTGAWTTDVNALTIANWTVKNDQGALTAATFADQDLCYSNNISKYTVNSTETDARLKFNTETKKFTGGNMNFYHALSKITFVVQHNETFKDDEFLFATGTNISMNSMNVKNATFNIESGEFTGAYTLGNITKMYQRSFADSKYTLDALVLPGTDMSDATNKDAISFTIAGNLYKLSKAELLAAIPEAQKSKLKDNKYLMPGVQYIFTLTISKTPVIHISAKVVDWEFVNADELTPSNARLTITTTVKGSNMENQFDLYRLQDTSSEIDTYQGYNWGNAYTDKTTVSYADSKWSLTTNWYWDNNMTYYHFRAVYPQNTTLSADNKSIPLSSAESYTDMVWGAPFTIANDAKVSYSTTDGFDGTAAPTTHQLYYAIGPTNDAINLTMFHVMSDVTFKVKTVSGDGAVKLVDGENKTEITLKNIKKDGNVAMGNGLVSATSTAEDWTFTQTPTTPSTGTYSWTAGIVPQSLTGVDLIITTPDGNQYIIDMEEVLTSTATPTYNNVTYPNYTDKKVNYWYPGVKYEYTFVLKKTGIEKMTATLVGWEKVTAGDDNVQIK